MEFMEKTNKPIVLKPKEIKERLKKFPGWTFAKNKISKKFKFEDFKDSISFIRTLIPFFDKHDHHPDVTVMYSTVLFELQRFDVGGKVTDKDFFVAREIESRYKTQKGK
jgi:4a-hydroxytetrahydrobiopterin dehydratase